MIISDGVERALDGGASVPEVSPGKRARAGGRDPGADERGGGTNEMNDHRVMQRVGESAQVAATSSSSSTVTAAADSLSATMKPKLLAHALALTAPGNRGEGVEYFVETTTNEFLIVARDVVDSCAHLMPSGVTKNVLMGLLLASAIGAPPPDAEAAKRIGKAGRRRFRKRRSCRSSQRQSGLPC
jgi:hypothetical protein